MSLPEIPTDVADFLAQHIDSVVRLEVLLLLAARAQTPLSAEEIARELRIDQDWTQSALSALAAAGILEGIEPGFRYAPRSPELDRTIRSLAKVYADRRVRVITLIFSRPTDPIRQFSEAFRFKKDQKG